MRLISALVLAAVFPAAHAQTLTIVHAFGRSSNMYPHGRHPPTMTLTPAGNFLSVTRGGGDDGNGCVGSVTCAGTLFLLTPAGQLKTYVNFVQLEPSGTYPLGGTPSGSLLSAGHGNYYGVTRLGFGGTIFRFNETTGLQTLYTFCDQHKRGCPDGFWPYPVVKGPGGAFYGVTKYGGANVGVVYRITAAGVFKAISAFKGTTVAIPAGPLVLAADGNFYGLSILGGTNGGGAIYSVTPAGAVKVVYSFGANSADGTWPIGALTQATDGNLYGVTAHGGVHSAGTLFRVSLAGDHTKLVDFDPSTTGGDPESAPIQASDGNLWGTVPVSSATSSKIYSVSLAGALLQIIPVTCPIGESVSNRLTQGLDGKLYGEARHCSPHGPSAGGTIFSLDAGLPALAPGAIAP